MVDVDVSLLNYVEVSEVFKKELSSVLKPEFQVLEKGEGRNDGNCLLNVRASEF